MYVYIYVYLYVYICMYICIFMYVDIKAFNQQIRKQSSFEVQYLKASKEKN